MNEDVRYEIITGKMNPHIDPVLDIWQWQVPVYLFIGGLCAGILILAAWAVLSKAKSQTAQRLSLAVLPLLGIGMGALFLDLENKWNVFQFFGRFVPSAPMSWGSWLLLLLSPIIAAFVLATATEAWPNHWEKIQQRSILLTRIKTLCEPFRQHLSVIILIGGISLAVYTGVLLSAYVARPFWNNSSLAILFLLSGLGAAAGLLQLCAPAGTERHRFGRVGLYVLIAEVSVLALFLINLADGTQAQDGAWAVITGGPLTISFWIFYLGLGVITPLTLELIALKKKVPYAIAPVLEIGGSMLFRFVIVAAGQLTTWQLY